MNAVQEPTENYLNCFSLEYSYKKNIPAGDIVTTLRLFICLLLSHFIAVSVIYF